MGTPSLSNLPFSRSTFFQVRGRTGHVAVLVPSGHRSGPVYVATSVGAGRLPLADSTRGGSRDRRFRAPESRGNGRFSGPRFYRGEKRGFLGPWPDGTSHERRFGAAELAEGSEQEARVFIRAGNFFSPWPDGTSHERRLKAPESRGNGRFSGPRFSQGGKRFF